MPMIAVPFGSLHKSKPRLQLSFVAMKPWRPALLRILMSLLFCTGSLPCLADELSKLHDAARGHKRRIVVQLDAADHRHINAAPEEFLRYIFAYVDEPGSQIDTIVWDMGLDGESAVYPSKVLPPTPDRQIRKWQQAGFEWVGAVVRECHKRHIEAFWNHRFSEVDVDADGNLEMKQLHPEKAAHPDWLIRSWWWQGLWNAASPGVRSKKVAILRELSEMYDFDGIQIDFARHIPALPPGRQWDNREGVTEFLRATRTTLLQVERTRGRPVLLSVKVPRTPEGAHEDGFDVAQWSKEHLVDLLTLGTRSMDVDLDGYRRITRGSGIKLMPCFDDHHATDGYRFASIEFLRGVFSNWWQQGADGVTTFNWGVAPPEWALRVGDSAAPATHGQAYREIGTPETMRGKDKTFAVERRGGYPWAEGYFGRNDDAPLPLKLPNDGRLSNFTIRVSDKIPTAASTLRLVLFGSSPDDSLEVRLNGTILASPTKSAWRDPQIFSPKPQPNSGGSGYFAVNPAQKLLRLQYSLPAESIQVGKNTVSICVLGRAPYPPGDDIQVEKIEIALHSQ